MTGDVTGGLRVLGNGVALHASGHHPMKPLDLSPPLRILNRRELDSGMREMHLFSGLNAISISAKSPLPLTFVFAFLHFLHCVARVS